MAYEEQRNSIKQYSPYNCCISCVEIAMQVNAKNSSTGLFVFLS